MTTQILFNSFTKGVGKTTGAAITLFIGWQCAKLIYGNEDFISFFVNKKQKRAIDIVDLDMHVVDTAETLETMEAIESKEKSFKKLFDGF
jgi:hypothetical protein